MTVARLVAADREEGDREVVVPLEAPRFKVLGLDQLLGLPDPEWLVDGVLPVGGFGLLYGEPGIGKSFVALDMALCVTTGTPWFGRRVRKGSVVYLALESLRGFKPRLLAWKERWKDPGDIRFIGEAPNLLDLLDVGELARAIRSYPRPQLPVLVVIDTLARAAGGVDENAAKDMGQVIASLDHLRTLLGGATSNTAILLVHHSPKGKSNTPRGSSALPGAVDVQLNLTGESDRLTLEVQKLRDGEIPTPLRLTLETVGGSAVVVPFCGETGSPSVSRSQLTTLRALAEIEVPGGVPASEWESSATVGRSTFYRHRKALIDRHLVDYTHGKYQLTEEGKSQVPRQSHFSPRGQATPSSPTPTTL